MEFIPLPHHDRWDVWYVHPKLLLTMKLIALLLVVTLTQVWAVGYSQNISLNMRNVPIEAALKAIERQSQYLFLYDRLDLPATARVSLSIEKGTIDETLRQVFRGLPLSYRIFNKSIVIRVEKSALQETKTPETPVVTEVADRILKGKVTDEKGEGLPGVSVLIKGTQRGTVTDGLGSFQLNLPEEKAILVFSFVGYISKEIAVSSQTTLSVSLAIDTKALEEIVVVGYGTERKANLTGSVATVNPKELRAVPFPTISQALMGRAAGVFIKNVNGQPGDNKVSFNIRGFGAALIIIDGLPATDNDYNQLDPNDIENISILKDAASAAVYGARAGNGVVLVKTRRGGVSEPKFTYTGNYSLQYFTKIPEVVNSEQYVRMENLAQYNQGLAPIWSDEQIQKFKDGSDPLHYPNTDWWGLTLRKYAPQAQHNINVQGGTEKVKYFEDYKVIK